MMNDLTQHGFIKSTKTGYIFEKVLATGTVLRADDEGRCVAESSSGKWLWTLPIRFCLSIE